MKCSIFCPFRFIRCTGNSYRSQMAEGWTKTLKEDQLETYSAGIQPKGVDPRAVKVMDEAGIDISGQSSKDIDSLPVQLVVVNRNLNTLEGLVQG